MTICCHKSNYIKMCTACCYFGTCTCCMELCSHTSQTLGTLYWPPLEKSIVAPSVRLYHFFSNQSQRETRRSLRVNKYRIQIWYCIRIVSELYLNCIWIVSAETAISDTFWYFRFTQSLNQEEARMKTTHNKCRLPPTSVDYP